LLLAPDSAVVGNGTYRDQQRDRQHDGTVAMDASSHIFISHPRRQPLLADRSSPSRCRSGPARIWLRANDSSCDRDGFCSSFAREFASTPMLFFA